MFGNFLFSKFFGNSIDEIADGRGFEPLPFHIQGIFAVSALFQRAAAMGDNITVAVHIGRIREKLEDDPANPRLLQTVWGVGHRLNAGTASFFQGI